MKKLILALAVSGALTLVLTGSAAGRQQSCGTFYTAGATMAV